LEIVFQNETSADAQNDKMAAPTKAETSARCREVNPRSGQRTTCPKGSRMGVSR
jgi:hypothetical protein